MSFGQISLNVKLLDVRGKVRHSVFGGTLESELLQLPVDVDIAAPIYDIRKPWLLEGRHSLPIFGEDSIHVVRQKISLATGIPPYRMHMSHFDENESTDAFYMLLLNGASTHEVWSRDIFGLAVHDSSAAPDLLFGCPIDFVLAKSRNLVRVETAETFSFWCNVPDCGAISVVDLADFIIRANELGLANAPQASRDLFYYGFVFKYWPAVTAEVFSLILSGTESRIGAAFPLMLPDFTVLAAQSKQVSDLNKFASTKRAESIRNRFDLSITAAEVTTIAATTKINMLALFNSVITNNNVPLITLMPSQYNQRITKTFVAAEIFDTIRWIKTPAEFKNGIVIALWIDIGSFLRERTPAVGAINASNASYKQLIFVNIHTNGLFSVISKWGAHYHINFTQHANIIAHFVNPLIGALNRNHALFMSGEFPLFSSERINFRTISVINYWNQIISNDDFKTLRNIFKGFVGSGVFDPNRFTNFLPEIICYNFNKAGTYQQPYFIDYRVSSLTFNYYSWQWNADVARIWQSTYQGFQTRIQHRATAVQIEVNNIKQQAFMLFQRYISAILSRLEVDTSKNPLVQFKKRINKLNNLDPDLFKFQRDLPNGKRVIYSILCQGPKQPAIYMPEELNALSDNQRRKLTEYWNFTHSKPAYYACPNSEYPHLAFQVGAHPRGFCLPCCQKLSQQDQPFYNNCLKREAASRDTKTNRHILQYSPYQIDSQRIAFCPDLSSLLNTRDFYLVGVPQESRNIGNIGFLNSVVMLCGTSQIEFIQRSLRVLDDLELINDLYEMFIRRNAGHINVRSPEEMNNLWMRMSSTIYGINIVVVNYERELVRTQLGYHAQNAIVLEKANYVYEPFVGIDLRPYYAIMEAGNSRSDVDIRPAIARRTFKFSEIRGLVATAVVANRINYSKTPDKISCDLVIGGTKFGSIYDVDGGALYLPSAYVKEGPDGTIASAAASPVATSIPYDKLRLPAFLQFARDVNLQVNYGIEGSPGKIQAAVDSSRRIYYFECGVDEWTGAGFTIGDHWHYDLNSIYAAIYQPVNNETFLEQVRADKTFASTLTAQANTELNKQISYRHFIYVFILALTQFRNVSMRASIMEKITTTRNFNSLGLDIEDARLLHEMITVYHRKLIVQKNYDAMREVIQQQRFSFDEEYLESVRTLPIGDLKTKLRSILGPFVQFARRPDTTALRLFYNLEHYRRVPLIIDSSELTPQQLENQFYDMLALDIRNPLLKNYFTTKTFESLFEHQYAEIDITQFTTKPGERLSFGGTFLTEEESAIHEANE